MKHFKNLCFDGNEFVDDRHLREKYGTTTQPGVASEEFRSEGFEDAEVSTPRGYRPTKGRA